MADAFTYRELQAWQQAMDLVEHIYRLTSRFPPNEQYGLTDQLRRAAVSIPANVAEGHCRRVTGAFRNHVSIALGSHGELETCVELAVRLKFVSAEQTKEIAESLAVVGRLLSG